MVIKTLELENPFAGYGTIVSGDQFVGRTEAIRAIHNRVLGNNYGNIAIMGLPRVGKSSLVWNALYLLKEDLSKKNILIERINMGSITNSRDLYLNMMDKALNDIRLLYNDDILNKLSKIRNNYHEKKNNNEIEFFFMLIKYSNYRLIFILDEFDNVNNFFNLEDFQLLRELSISPETKICLVTISRRTIQELEPQNGAISNFYGVFSDLNLQLFNDRDLMEYWERIKNLGIEISEEYINKIKYFVGNHPFWIDMINYHIFNEIKLLQRNSIDLLVEIESEIKKTLWDNYENIISLLDNENLKKQFIQAVVGPVIDLDQISIEKLLKYGIIQKISAKEKYGNYFDSLINANLVEKESFSYTTISEHLAEYLKQKELEIDIWPLWNDTEQQIRKLITMYLIKKFGDNWQDEYLRQYPNKQLFISRLEEKKNKSYKDFGELSSKDLIDYTYPLDIWNYFISIDWGWFQQILCGNKSSWQEKFYLISKMRNPIAHSNRDFVQNDDFIRAKEICNTLNDKITIWINSQNI